MDNAVPVAPDVWQKLKAGIPYTNSAEDVQKRKELWKKLDTNGNGQLTLHEVGTGLRNTLGLPELAEAKLALHLAFDAAKKKVAGTKADNATVSEAEFQYLLFFLRQYFEYWVAFNRVDSNPNHRITIDEFKKAAPNFGKWGLKVTDPEQVFKQIDSNHNGSVTFGEFVKWASSNTLHLDDIPA